MKEDGGLYVWDAATGWTKLDVVQGPRGDTGPAGQEGPTGSDGPAGPAASSYMIVPFASMDAPTNVATNGEPSTVTLLGFSSSDGRIGADYAITIDPSDRSFSLTGNDNSQMPFSLPFDVSIRSIYITVGTWGSILNTEHAIFPCVQLYRADAGSNNFTIIEGAIAIPEQGIGPGTNIPADTMRSGHTDGLDIRLAAGTRLAIGAMLQIPGHTGGALPYYIYFTGGIGLTYESAV